MDSSQSDEFFDDWGSPGFRDQLFRNVALAEMQAEQAQATNNNSCSHKLIQTNTHERSGTSLQVFRDPLDHVKGSVAFPQQHPLREIDLNQHDTGFNNNHKKLGKEGVQKRKQDTTIITVADNSTINQSLNDSMDTNQSNNASKLQEQQNPNNVDMKKADIDEDEEMWGVEFDIDFPELLNDLERNHDTTAQNNESSFKIDIHPIDETKEVSFDKKQMESTLFEFGGFETAGSRKPLRINNEARKNAFALFSVDSIDSGLNKAISSTSPGNNTINNPLSVPNTQKDTTTINARDHKTDPTDDKVKIQESLEGFSGFKTASNRTIPRISEESLRKAERLLLGSQSHDMQTGTLPATEKKEEQTQNGTVKISNSNNSIVNDQQRPPFATANSDNEETIPPPTKILHGFKTASGRDISPTSKEALYKAEKLVLATQSPDEQTKISMKGESTGTVNGEMSVCGEKRSSDNDHYDSHDDNNDTDDNQLQFKYEDLLSRHGGFTKGTSDITISVSVDAKQRAVALFNSSETTRELTQASQSISSQRLSSTSSPLRGNSQQQQYNDHSSLPSQRTISSLEETQPSPSSPKQKSPERFPPLPPHPRKRLKRRPQAAMLKMKPFKSPVIQSKYELTKAAASGKVSSASVRYKGKPVFSINSQSPRHPLSQLGKPLQYTVVDLKNMDISDEIIYLTANNAATVQFSGWGPKDAHEAMLKAGASEQFISMGWVENHYRWILWKIASLIRSYPTKFREWWCPNKVVEQLLYRYEREINLGHRPVLKRVHEHDDVPAKHMVLIIADIKNMINAEGISPGARDYELVLTDGWYQIKAVTDSRMERAIARGKLVIGSKLAICGAQLGGDSQPRSPLSASSNDTYLSITTNGSRLVPWDTKLGYQKDRLIFRSLSTVFEDGGLVTAMDVIVCRKYPMMYTETLSDGTRIKRTAREEEEIRRRMGAEFNQYMMDEGESGWTPKFQEFSGMRMNMQREQSSPGGDLSVLPSKLENRNVSVHFKMQLCDYHCSGNKKIKQKMATLLLLNANELNHMDIQEGSRYRIFFTMPYTFLDKSNSSNNTSHLNTSSTLHLKTTHKTRWENIANVDEEKMASTLYIPRFITMTALMETLEKNSEIDIAALVIHFTCSDKAISTMEGRSLWYQTLLIVDPSGGLCQVKLKLPYRPVNGMEGQVIGFTNLIYEAHDPKYSIAHLRASDNSEIFNKQKTAPYMQKAIYNVRQWAQNNPQKIQAMKERVNKILLNLNII